MSAFHLEVKRVELFNAYKAYEQAVRDSQGKKIPLVAHRRSRKDWLVVLSAEDFFSLLLTRGLINVAETGLLRTDDGDPGLDSGEPDESLDRPTET